MENLPNIRGPFANFVDWRQCSTVMPSCSGGGNVGTSWRCGDGLFFE